MELYVRTESVRGIIIATKPKPPLNSVFEPTVH